MLRNVLVIEDDRDIAHLVKIHVEGLHCQAYRQVDGAGTGARAGDGGRRLLDKAVLRVGTDRTGQGDFSPYGKVGCEQSCEH